MWDDDDRDDDETASQAGRRRPEEPIDLPLGGGSTAVRLPPRPVEPPPVAETRPAPKKKKAPPLFPDWTPVEPAGSPSAVESAVRSDARTSAASPLAPPTIAAGDDARRVSAGSRALAGGVDLAIGGLVAGVVILAVKLGGGFPLAAGPMGWSAAFAAELTVVGAVLSLFLFGRTPGMAMASIGAEEADGMPIRFQRAVTRVLGGLALLVIPGLSLLVAAIREDGRSLTDVLSGTVLLPRDDEA